LAQAEFIIECSPAYHFPLPQGAVTLRYSRNGPRKRHILLDTIFGSTKNMYYHVAYGRLKSFRSYGKKEWMLFSLVCIPPVHDEWTDLTIPPQGRSDPKLESRIICPGSKRQSTNGCALDIAGRRSRLRSCGSVDSPVANITADALECESGSHHFEKRLTCKACFFAADHRRNHSLCGPVTGDPGYMGRTRLLSRRGIEGYPEPAAGVSKPNNLCSMP
jgi:hypothetical protein